MSALYETANDLTAIRDVDAILAAIVRRARSLLHADMTYLSLNDEADGASYMKVTDGALTPEFRRLRLPLGTGLLGLVAQTGEPYYTEDYQTDERFVHKEFIDSAVDGEKIRAILGVPLTVEGKVIGALLAVHRTVRPFPPGEVSLLMSFAAHAAVALENARLFEQLDRGQPAGAGAGATPSRSPRTPTTSSPTCCCTAAASTRSPTCSPTCCDGPCVVLDSEGHRLAGDASAARPLDGPRRRGRARPGPRAAASRWPAGGPSYVAVALAGTEHLGTLLLHGRARRARHRRPAHPGARRPGHRAGAAVRPVGRRGRGAGRAASCSATCWSSRDLDEDRLRERARRQHADLDGPTGGRGGRRRRASSGTGPPRWPPGSAGELRGLAGEHDGRVVLVAPARGRRSRSAGSCTSGCARPAAVSTVGVAPAAERAGRRRRRPTPRPGGCLDTLVTLGRAGEVSDPAGLGLARLLLGQNGPEELDAFIEAMVGPVLAYDARRGTELVGHPGGVVRRRRPSRGDRQAAARAPEHRRPAARPDRHPARRRLARPGPRPRRPAGAAALPAPRPLTTRPDVPDHIGLAEFVWA